MSKSVRPGFRQVNCEVVDISPTFVDFYEAGFHEVYQPFASWAAISYGLDLVLIRAFERSDEEHAPWLGPHDAPILEHAVNLLALIVGELASAGLVQVRAKDDEISQVGESLSIPRGQVECWFFALEKALAKVDPVDWFEVFFPVDIKEMREALRAVRTGGDNQPGDSLI